MFKKHKVSFTIVLFFFYATNHLEAQQLSTLGKTFWLTFMESIGSPDNTPELKIVISSNKATSGTVKNPVTNVSVPFSIGTGGGVDTVLITTTQGYTTGSEGTSNRNRALLVQAKDTVSVSAQNTKTASCDAALIYPIEALGVDYRILSYPGDIYSGGGTNASYRSSFAIVATENNTTIDITPSCATMGGNAANTTFSITLQKGESYQVKAGTKLLDLTGTLVQAKDCKKIAVFGGATRSVIVHSSCPFGINSADHLYEQMMPINLWGKKFAMIPTTWQANVLRKVEMVAFVTSLPSTSVRFNGRSKNYPNAGMHDTFFIVTTGTIKEAIITSTKPIAICQYALSQRCDGATSDTDPMMMWLPPLEQTLKFLNFSCEQADKIDKFFINVVVKTQFRNQLKIDGASPTASWKLVSKDTSYSYIQQSGLNPGNHNMTHPVGFFAILYAYGDYGSYGYNVGSSIKPLSFYSIVNGKSSSDFESDSMFYSVCQDATIPFDGGGSTTTGVTWKWIIRDKTSTITKTTKGFNYTFKDTGQFSVTMIAQRPVNGTCNGQTTIDDTVSTTVDVYKKPFLMLMSDTTICLGNTIKLMSVTDGDTNYIFSPPTWLNCSNCFEPEAKPLKDTAYYVVAKFKGCTPNRDTIHIRVRDSIKLSTSPDTTICRGTSALLRAYAKGGLTSALTLTWDHGLGNGISKTVNPRTTTLYRVILTDGCTRDSSGNISADTNYIRVIVYDSLKITMPNDTLLCEGNPLTLTATISGGKPNASTVTWNKSLGTGLSKLVTADSSITYKAVLSDGCTVPNDSGFVNIRVRPALKIDSVFFPAEVCRNQVVRISARASGGDSSGYRFKLYNETAGNLLIDSSRNTAAPNFLAKITDDSKYYIQMKQTCNSHQISSKSVKQILIKLKTGVAISVPKSTDTVCTGQNFTLKVNGSSADNLPVRFVLKKKNGNSYLSIDSFTHATTGTFTITPTASSTEYLLTGDDNCSRPDSAIFTLIVRAPVAVSALADTQLCRNTPVTYTAVVTGGKPQNYTYRWYDVSANDTLAAGKSFTFTPAQTMRLGLEINDACSPMVNSKAQISLSPLVTDSLMATKINGCEPFRTEFIFPSTQAITPLNTSFTWIWTFDGANPVSTNSKGGDTHANIPKTYPAAGIHDARIRMALASGQTCFDKTINIESWQQAKAGFTFSPQRIDVIEPEVTFTNTSTGASQYQWMYSDGGTDTIKHPQHVFGDTGWYSVVLVASNVHNCNDTFTDRLQVLDIFRIFIPDAFSPNQDEINTLWFPQMTSTFSCQLQIFNRWGEKLLDSDDISGRWDGKYKGEECATGVYYYHLRIRDNRMKWHYYNGMITLIR